MKTNSTHLFLDRRLIPLTKEYLSSAIHPDHLDDNQQVTNICMDTLVNNHSALINGPNSGKYSNSDIR